MDAATIVPASGLGAVLILLVGYVLRQIVADRGDYRQALTDERERTKAAEARLAAERRRADAAQALVDAERTQRRDAEAHAAAAAAQLAAQQSMLAWYRTEVDSLRRYLPPPISPGILPDPLELTEGEGS